ncbi:asparaginase [Arthrobacter sp. I2-34]|uniref:asparaginase n=1 Tax=Arthrobacter hankyongi TaxID=2904801 RepID=A0ABS9LAS2_9MICC|nr:asparaginase [Arthrobacter hankyongi]MCG2623760.1 asparaginase [Arthrobacter hankyongi]
MIPQDTSDPHVVLLATGGTIASRSRPEAGGAAIAADTGEQLLGSLGASSSCPVRVVDVLRKGSYLLGFDEMAQICSSIRAVLRNPAVLGVVVTHGTDTMEETAFLAELTHDDPRPVVFTGAQKAADSGSPDGPENLAQAVAVAASPQARGRGVLLSFAGRIFPARGVQKAQTLDLDAFANPDVGAVGWVTAGGSVHLGHVPPRPAPIPLPPVAAGTGVRVDVVASYPGADDVLLRAALEAGAAGIVLQATGSGNANRVLCSAVGEATAAGVVVVTSTRVHAGPVVPIYGDGGGKDLLAAGAIPSGILRPSQTLVLLSLLLRLDAPRPQIAGHFARYGQPLP